MRRAVTRVDHDVLAVMLKLLKVLSGCCLPHTNLPSGCSGDDCPTLLNERHLKGKSEPWSRV